MADSQSSAAPCTPHVPPPTPPTPHPMANPGYGKRSAPAQLPRDNRDFAHLPPREASIAAYIDRLPEGSDISVKTLAKHLPYGQCALRTALNRLQDAGHLRRGSECVANDEVLLWVTRRSSPGPRGTTSGGRRSPGATYRPNSPDAPPVPARSHCSPHWAGPCPRSRCRRPTARRWSRRSASGSSAGPPRRSCCTPSPAGSPLPSITHPPSSAGGSPTRCRPNGPPRHHGAPCCVRSNAANAARRAARRP